MREEPETYYVNIDPNGVATGRSYHRLDHLNPSYGGMATLTPEDLESLAKIGFTLCATCEARNLRDSQKNKWADLVSATTRAMAESAMGPNTYEIRILSRGPQAKSGVLIWSSREGYK